MTSGRWVPRSRGLVVGLAALVGFAVPGPGVARAQVPDTMNFQGLLLDAAGQPKNGTVTLGFGLYDAPVGGTALWSETLVSVPVTDGIYDVVLGATTPLTAAVFSSDTRYLEVSVDSEVLAPRRQLLVVPYAVRAEAAEIASALAENGANCPAGSAAAGVDASGAAEGCVDPLASVGEDTSPFLGGTLNGSGFGATNFGNVRFRGMDVLNSSPYLGADQDNRGWGWKVGFARGSQYVTPMGLDTGFSAAFNSESAGGGIDTDFGPSLISSIEGAWASSNTIGGVSAISPQAEIHTDFYTKWGAFDIDDLSSGFALAEKEVFVIREATGDENVLIVARLKDFSSPTLQAYWYPSVDKSNPPGDGDRLETGSNVSVSGRSGGDGVFATNDVVYLFDGACLDTNPRSYELANTGVGIVMNGAVGGDNDQLVILQTKGTRAQFDAGTTICEIDGSAITSATIDSAAASDTARVNGAITNSYDAYRMGPIWDYRYFDHEASYILNMSAHQDSTGRFAMSAGTDAGGFSYVTLLGNGRGGFGPGPSIQMGDYWEPVLVRLYGETWQWDGNSHYGIFDMADLATNRTYLFPDRDGDVLLRNGAWGAAGSVPITDDASGSAVIDSGIRVDTTTAGANVVALPSDTEDASELRFYEDASHPGGNFISLRAARATKDLTGDASYEITRLTRASAASTNRSPVIGAVAIPSTLDTGEKLCQQQYDAAATGVAASCLPGSAKKFDIGTAAPAWVGYDYPNDNCTGTVAAGTYFEVVCTVED